MKKITLKISFYYLDTTCKQVEAVAPYLQASPMEGIVFSYRLHTTGIDPDRHPLSSPEAQHHTQVRGENRDP